MSVRLMQLADFAEVWHRVHGLEGTIEHAQRHAGRVFSPAVVSTFRSNAADVLPDLEDATWEYVIEAEPRPRPPLTDEEFEGVLEVMADIADLKSPWFSGHSRGVANLPSAAVKEAGMPERDVVTTRRAGLVHDLGRTAISTMLWDKRDRLAEGERERVRLHAYYTERMLRRPAALAGLASIAASHHERLDGSGYHRAIRGSDIPLLGRYLAAADVYHAMLEDRPFRPAFDPKDVATHLRGEARAGRLDAPHCGRGPRRGGASDETGSVRAGRPHASRGRGSGPGGARASTRHVARTLNITPKTAGNHIERIYAKIGASSRSTATLFAMQHGMLATLEPVQR